MKRLKELGALLIAIGLIVMAISCQRMVWNECRQYHSVAYCILEHS